MSKKEEEYLRRQRELGYDPSLAGMDEEDFDYVPSWAQNRQREERLFPEIRPGVDRAFAERIFRMFARPFDRNWKMPDLDGPEFIKKAQPEDRFSKLLGSGPWGLGRPAPDRGGFGNDGQYEPNNELGKMATATWPGEGSAGAAMQPMSGSGGGESDTSKDFNWGEYPFRQSSQSNHGQGIAGLSKNASYGISANIPGVPGFSAMPGADSPVVSERASVASMGRQQERLAKAVGDGSAGYEELLGPSGFDFNSVFQRSPKGSIDYAWGKAGKAFLYTTGAKMLDAAPNLATAAIIAAAPEAATFAGRIKPVVTAVCEAEKRMLLNWESVEQGKYTYSDAVKESLGPLALKLGGEYTAKTISEAAAKEYNLPEGARAAMETLLGKIISKAGEKITRGDDK